MFDWETLRALEPFAVGADGPMAGMPPGIGMAGGGGPTGTGMAGGGMAAGNPSAMKDMARTNAIMSIANNLGQQTGPGNMFAGLGGVAPYLRLM